MEYPECKRTGAVVLCICFFWINSISVSATEYAYSIGHNFGINNPLVVDYEGDFTPNVSYAATVYGMIGYSSYYNYNPTCTYLRGSNPGGSDRLGSSIVFLNGHASNADLLCGDTTDEGDYRCGVHRDIDIVSTSTGYRYAGLGSRNMFGVKLISFVGCNTASTNDNLCSKAISKGATCAMGFINNINSRTADGQNWLIYYHNALYNGSSILEAAVAATVAVPNSDLGSYVSLKGDYTIDICFSKSAPKGSQLEMTESEKLKALIRLSKTTDFPIGIEEDDIMTSAVIIFKITDGKIEYMSCVNDLNKYKAFEKTALLSAKRDHESVMRIMKRPTSNINEIEQIIINDEKKYYYFDYEEGALFYVIDTVYSYKEHKGVSATNMNKIIVSKIL